MKRSSAVVASLAITTALYAQTAAIQAPEPSKDMVVKICTTDYFGRNSRCETRQFLEKRGNDLVYLVQQEGSDEKGELILTADLSTKLRPFPPATYVPHSYFLQFPLENGRTWKGTFDQTSGSETRNRTRTARVTGYVDLAPEGGHI